MNRTHPDSGRITTSSDVIADLRAEIERLERSLSHALATAAQPPAPREPLTYEQLLSITKACGIQFYPAQLSSVLATDTDEHTLYEFAKAIMVACGATTHKEQSND